MNDKTSFNEPNTPSADNITGNPDTCNEMITRYGTYEIQATADTENIFPAIAQGLLRQKTKKDKKKP